MPERKVCDLLYPRKDSADRLVSEDQMVGYREHLASKHRTLSFTGELSGEVESCNILMALDSLSHDPIKVYIASGGGLLMTAFMLYDTMRLVKSPIYTIGRFAFSAAVMLLAAGRKRYLLPHAKVMLHLPSGEISGDAEEIRIAQGQMEQYKNDIVSILLECGAKKPREEILIDIDREFWLRPEQAIAYGLADEILTPKVVQKWLK